MKKIYLVLAAIVVCTFSLRSYAQVLPADSSALVDIYNAAGGPNWANQGNWLVGTVDTWEGVVVSNGRVTELSMYQGDMSGTISPSIGQLTELTKLEIKGDEDTRTYVDIHGSLPAELWNCTKITRLQIKFTNITGNIPAGIESMTALQEINFQGTKLGCQIPEELFNLPSLIKPYLHESDFTGTVPTTLQNATQLQRLYLQGNKLQGPLPFVELANGGANCKVQLTGNFFSFADVKPYHDAKAGYAGFTDDYQYAKEEDTVSVSVGGTVTLDGTVDGGEAYVWFKEGSEDPVGTDAQLTITGAAAADQGVYTCEAQSSLVPEFYIRTIVDLNVEMSALQADSLALVDIYNAAGGPNWANQGNWLVGTVDTWEGVVVSNGRVTELSMYQGDMSGTISPSIGQLTELTKLEIKGDEDTRTYVDIHGSLPAELWNCTKITRLQIKFTNITGNIPAGIESMTALQEINFQGTKLGCQIPEELFNLPSLIKPYLHESDFTGTVPTTLQNATQLQRLYLQGNKLQGPLPFVELADGGANCKVELTGNFFSFADVKPYHDAKAGYKGFTDDYQLAQETQEITAAAGSSLSWEQAVDGGESYAWFKDNIETPVSTENSYNIASVSKADQGVYVCKVQSSLVPDFDIRATYILNGGTAIPAYVSGVTSADGATITLSFDVEMADPQGEEANFAVSVDGTDVPVASVAIDGADSKNIVLTLGTAVTSKNAAITVSYVPGTVAGSTGGSLAAFGPVAVDNMVTVGVNLLQNAMKIYPNPMTDMVNIKSDSKIDNVGIYTISGQKILEIQNLSGNLVAIPVSELQKGIYMLKVKTENTVISRRVLKE